MGLADANLGLADVEIDPAEVLPRRVRNLLGPHTSAVFMSASGEASLDSSLVMFQMFFTTFPLVLCCVPGNVSQATGSTLVATKKTKMKPTLNYAELATLLAKAANIVNDRPIVVKNTT